MEMATFQYFIITILWVHLEDLKTLRVLSNNHKKQKAIAWQHLELILKNLCDNNTP